MEAILVPESSSALEAGVVTVRSVAVQVALEKEFLNPGEIMLGCQLRSDLVHGTPTSGVPDKEAGCPRLVMMLRLYGVGRDDRKHGDRVVGVSVEMVFPDGRPRSRRRCDAEVLGLSWELPRTSHGGCGTGA